MRNPSLASLKKTSTTTPCCSKVGIKRGPWTPEEDELLANYIKKEGEGRWRTMPKRAGLLRCGKSCRLRWMNYLRPSVKRGRIAPDEEDLILRLHRLLGNRWSLIAGRIPGRTDNEIKNYWNTHLSKKLISQGIDPRTHKPLDNPNPNNTLPNDDDHHQNQNTSNPSSFHLEENGKTYKVVATKVSENFTMAHLDHDQYQNQVANNNDHHIGTENWPNCDGLLLGFQGGVLHHAGQNNEEDNYNIIGNIGNDQDTFTSFLDSLISDQSVFANQQQQQQQQQQQPQMNIRTSFDNPLASPAQNFNHNAIWEAELVLSPMAAIADQDDALNRHLA